METSSGVTVAGVKKTYRGGVEALRGVDLQIGTGLFGLLGPNGAGKTTLLRIIATLLVPTGGCVTVDGRDSVRDRESIRASLGYLPQEFGLYPRLSAAEHIRYFCDLKGVHGAAVDAEVDRLTASLGLEAVASRPAATLSGGMRQRVGVAIALVGSPRLLIVDEPTVGLDPEERARFRNMLVDIARDSTVILSTHIVQDIEAGCSRAAIIAGGLVRAVGSPRELASGAEGRVWSVTVDQATSDRIRVDYPVMDMRAADDGQVVMRVAGAGDLPGAVSVAPRLEDAYMLMLRDEAPVAS